MPDASGDDSRERAEGREDDPRQEGSAGEEGTDESEEHPRGTLFLMLLFLMMIVALWGYVYFDLIRMSS